RRAPQPHGLGDRANTASGRRAGLAGARHAAAAGRADEAQELLSCRTELPRLAADAAPAAPGGARLVSPRAEPAAPTPPRASTVPAAPAARQAEPQPGPTALPVQPAPAAVPSPEEAPAPDDAASLRIAWLEGRVAALEAALERRSGEVLLLQRFLCA